MDFQSMLVTMVEKQASDLFLTVGVPPSIKAHGQLIPLSNHPLSQEQAHALVLGMMTETQRETFEKTHEINFAIVVENLSRFRVSAFQQRLYTGAVLRRIENKIPTLEALDLPVILKDLAMADRGLVMVVGRSGAGKSSTLAAMLGHHNMHAQDHIISIEDPIEFVHDHAGCIITQREVGVDTDSFETALKNSLRQAPDVILIGEIRTSETMKYAVSFAETGHLCLATLHANNANQALDRIAHFFSTNAQRQLWMDLSLNLKAIIAQQLIPSKTGDSRVVAVEILINTPVIADHIRKGDVDVLKELMAKSNEHGMQTFDQALYRLYSAGKISYESALKHADSENEVRLMIKLGKGDKLDAASDKLSLQ